LRAAAHLRHGRFLVRYLRLFTPEPAPFAGPGYNAAGRTPGISNFDLDIQKNFAVREGMALQFRAEWFNLFNHTQFSGVGTTLGTATFGRVYFGA
jgi:hypothetical protein